MDLTVDHSHPVQLLVLFVVIIADILCLIALNRIKASGHRCSWSWTQKRSAYWLLIGAVVTAEVLLDTQFSIGPTVLAVKAYANAFSLGLLDLYFSETRGVSLHCVAGAALWCSTVMLRQTLVRYVLDEQTILVDSISVSVILSELLRFVLSLPMVGILSDLIFSPMHRLMHHRLLYTRIHKRHHEFTNTLTSLVLYHGELLDDFLMPLTTVVGGFLYCAFLGLVGLQGAAFSSVTTYLIIFNTLLSHAHDTRCARLMAPLPDSLNFVAYHYVHHLSPSNNFGLTKLSDTVWDTVFGVSTIRNLVDFEQKQK